MDVQASWGAGPTAPRPRDISSAPTPLRPEGELPHSQHPEREGCPFDNPTVPSALQILGTRSRRGLANLAAAAASAPSPRRGLPEPGEPRAPRGVTTAQAPHSLFAVVTPNGFGHELLPRQRRLGLAVRAGGEKPRHGDGAEGLRRAQPDLRESRHHDKNGPRSPLPDPHLPSSPQVPRSASPPPRTRPKKYPPSELARHTAQPERRKRGRRGKAAPTSLPGDADELCPRLQFPAVSAPRRGGDRGGRRGGAWRASEPTVGVSPRPHPRPAGAERQGRESASLKNAHGTRMSC